MKTLIDTDLNEAMAEYDRVIVTPSGIAKKTFFYLQEVGYLKCLIPHISKRENMDSYLLIFVLSGEGDFTYEDRKTHVQKGACFFIDCMIPYSHECSDKYPWELLWVHFNGSNSSQYYKYIRRTTAPIFYPAESLNITNIIRQLIHINQKKPPYTEAICSSLVVQLLTTILTVQKNIRIDHTSNSIERKLLEIQQYLDTNLTKKISLDCIAHEFYISKYYMCREFKKKFGVSIMTYISMKRISLGKEILRFTDKSVAEISSLCGIKDATYFIRQFKTSEGITPTEYRRLW